MDQRFLPEEIAASYPPSESALFDAVRSFTQEKNLQNLVKRNTWELTRKDLSLLRALAEGHDFSNGLFLGDFHRSGDPPCPETLFACSAQLRWNLRQLWGGDHWDQVLLELARQVYSSPHQLQAQLCQFVVFRLHLVCDPNDPPGTWPIGSAGSVLLSTLAELREEELSLAAGEWLTTYWIQDYGDLLWMQMAFRESISFEDLCEVPEWVRDGRDVADKCDQLWSDKIECYAKLVRDKWHPDADGK